MPLLAVLFIIGYSVVATAVVIDNWKAAMIGVGLLLLFVLIYFGTKGMNAKEGINAENGTLGH